MSSSPANSAARGTPHGTGFHRAIVTRLAAGYAIAASLLVAGAGVYLYDGLRSGLEEEDQALIADKVRLLRIILAEEPANPGALKAELQLQHGDGRFNPYFARVLDARGNIVSQTPGMQELLPPPVFPEPLAPETEPSRGSYWTAPGGRVFLLLAAEAAPSFGDGAPRGVQTAIDVSAEFKLLEDYRKRLLAAMAVGILVSLAAGVLVARHGLRPIDEMTRTVRRITPSRLHARVAAAGWPSELAGLAAAFDEMLDRLEESFERLRRLSDDIAHELRTPVNNILGQTEVALTRAGEGAAAREVLGSNLEEIRRMAALIDSLLFLSRADNAVTALARTTFDVRPVLEATVELYGPLAEEKGVRLTCDGGARVSADEGLFRRAISNLASNALAFVETNGAVLLSAAQGADGSVAVRVRDSGIGIADEHLGRIFDRFYRIRDPAAEPREGTGLGLAIVKSILALHGGTVSVESRPGHGTTFEMVFPAAPRPLP